MRLPEGAQHSVGHLVRSTVLRPFVALNGTVSRARAQARDYDLLRAQTDSLLTWVAAHRTLAAENRQLRGLLALPARRRSRFVSSTVIRPTARGDGSVFFLDVGAEAGLERFQAVVTEVGLLGQVQDVRAGAATAFDWSHPDFRASAMTPDGETHGLVEPLRGQHREQDLLVLKGTAYLSGLEPGTQLVTSGRGGGYPRGILIGWVLDVAETAAGWSKSYFVEPAVYPGAVTHALVEIGPLQDTLAADTLLADSAAESGASGAIGDAGAEARPDSAASEDALR